jgi:hypothetical protein
MNTIKEEIIQITDLFYTSYFIAPEKKIFNKEIHINRIGLKHLLNYSVINSIISIENFRISQINNELNLSMDKLRVLMTF